MVGQWLQAISQLCFGISSDSDIHPIIRPEHGNSSFQCLRIPGPPIVPLNTALAFYSACLIKEEDGFSPVNVGLLPFSCTLLVFRS